METSYGPPFGRKEKGGGHGGPFIFIGTHRLNEGRFSDFEAAWRDLVAVVEANEPQMIARLAQA